MTYVPATPVSTSSPSSSVSSIQVNFSEFASIFSHTALGVIYNHMALNDFNQGKHACVILQKQISAPGVTQDLDVLYCEDVTTNAGTEPQLFVQIPKFLPTDLDTTPATNDPMQLTYGSVGISGPIYYSFLPGGFLIYFGSTNTIGTPITLVPTPTKVLCAQAFPTGTGNANHGTPKTNVPYDVWVAVTQPDQVKINSTRAPGGSTFLWMAIGRQ